MELQQTTHAAPLNERLFLLTLAGIQFTHILDFMIIMPLGPQLIRSLDLTAQQFGLLLSCYTLAAGVSSMLAAAYVDRFDRRKLQLFLYASFIVSVLLSGLAPHYWLLLVARGMTGAVGGVMSAMTQTMIADVIPYERRGRAVGFVMTAFSVATVVGVPIGLMLSHNVDLLGWRAPFFMVGTASLVILMLGVRHLPSLTGHMQQGVPRNLFEQIGLVLRVPNHLNALVLMACLMMAGFTVTPFIALYLTTNVAVPESFLSVIYLCGGGATFFTARIIGRWSDRFGKQEMLRWVLLCSMVSLLVTTHLVPVPLWFVLINSTCYFILVSGRHIPGTALVTQTVQPQIRGTFMSLVSSVKMFSAALGSFLTGVVISRTATGQIEHFNLMGYVAVAFGLLAIWVAQKLRVEEDE